MARIRGDGCQINYILLGASIKQRMV